MRKHKVKTDYTKVKDSELAILAGKVAAQMDNNPHFSSTIKPSAEDVLNAAEDYRIKQEIAINGGSTFDKNLKNESKAKLLEVLSHLAHAVNIEAKGDIVALSSTGLMLYKQPAVLVAPGFSTRLQLRDGRVSGQLLFDFEKIPDTYEYQIQTGLMDRTSDRIIWEESFVSSTSIGNLIDNLTPGLRYYARVRGKNRIGYGDWSEVVSMIVR